LSANPQLARTMNGLKIDLEKTGMPISVSEIFGTFSNRKSLKLFRIIATEGGTSESLIPKLGISRKEYYLRMSRLSKVGMIKRKDNKYCLTIFGGVIYGIHLILADAVKRHSADDLTSVRKEMKVVLTSSKN
jgi:predicted transcriptional regulator